MNARHGRPAPARALALAAALLLSGAACTSVPLEPVPEPLPEALEWKLPAADGAFLGLKTEENDSGSLDALFFEPGARVVHVIENSPAAAAGVQPGDVVLTFEGATVDDPGALDALVARQPPGTRVELTVQRGDTVLEVPVTLAGAAGAGGAAQGEEPTVLWRADPARSRAGWLTAPDGSGVVLVSLAPGSPCAEAGLVPGDVVVALDGREVHSDRELIRLLQEHDPGAEVVLAVREGGGATRNVDVTLQDQPTRLTGVNIPILFHYAAAPDGHSAEVDVLDFWILSLFNYERQEHERTYTILKIFGWRVFSFSVGEGELGS